MKKMIAYCGLACEKCDAYLATLRDDQALREKTAKAWSARAYWEKTANTTAATITTLRLRNLCKIRKSFLSARR